MIELGNASENYASLELTLDLQEQIISATNGFSASFEIDPGSKKMVMEGLDNIGLTLCKTKEIETFRSLDREQRPWVYAVGRDGFEP